MAQWNVWLKRVLLLGLLVLVISLSLSYRLGKIGPDDFIDARRPVDDIVINSWIKTDSDDLLRVAENTSDKKLAKDLLLQALAIDLTSGRAIVKLADSFFATDDLKTSEQLAELGGRLTTAQSSTHTHLAALWDKLNKPDKVLAEWDILLTRDAELRSSMWPYLQEKLTEPNAIALFDKLANKNSNWWPGFFIFLTRNSKITPELLDHFYELRSSHKLLTDSEVTTYVARLMQDNQWLRAKHAWDLGLTSEQAVYKGLLYDGSFESDKHNTGFDWYFSPPKQIKIAPDITFGMQGKKALRINFLSAQRLNFQHVWQRLVLEPGNYTMLFNYRTDSFQNTKGMQWRLWCISDNKLLAESVSLVDTIAWKTAQFDFTIPKSSNCPAQLLRLEAASKFAHEQVFSGNLWLDTIQLKPQ